jgi:recombinational DNA repair protein (RecF pathway)
MIQVVAASLRLLANTAILLPLVACDLSKGTLNQTGFSVSGPGAASPYNGKNYADPHPQSGSNDAQRAAYQQHQDEQRTAPMAAPDLSKMSCTGDATSQQGSNSGSMNSTTNCHS